MVNEILDWEITPSEKRERIKTFISKTWLTLVGIVLLSLFYYVSNFLSWTLREGIRPALLRVVHVTIGVAISILLFFLANKFIPYKTRTYRLDNEGIEISKGKKEKKFLGKNLNAFILTDPIKVTLVTLATLGNLRGDSF